MMDFEEILISLGFIGFSKLKAKNASSQLFLNKEKKEILKVTYKNEKTKGLHNEYLILFELQNSNFTPKPFKYVSIVIENKILELLLLEYIEGATINSKNYFHNIECKIKERLYELYKSNICHGDIKKENIIVKENEIFLIDFDQAYKLNMDLDFENSPDICGNIYSDYFQMNYIKLYEEIKTWKKEI